jgi:hypothetical protein
MREAATGEVGRSEEREIMVMVFRTSSFCTNKVLLVPTNCELRALPFGFVRLFIAIHWSFSQFCEVRTMTAGDLAIF